MNLTKPYLVLLSLFILFLTGCKGSDEIKRELAPLISDLDSNYSVSIKNGSASITLSPTIKYKDGSKDGIKYSWTFISYKGNGVENYRLSSTTSRSTVITMLTAGNYQFKVRAEGNRWGNYAVEAIVNITVTETAASSLSAKSFSVAQSETKNLSLLTGYEFQSSQPDDAWVWGTKNHHRWLTVYSLSDSRGLASTLRQVASSDYDHLILDLTTAGYTNAEQAEHNAQRLAELINVGPLQLEQHSESVRYLSLASYGAGTSKERLTVVILVSAETSAIGELLVHMISQDSSRSTPVVIVGQPTLGALQWLNYFSGSTPLQGIVPVQNHRTNSFESTVIKALSL